MFRGNWVRVSRIRAVVVVISTGALACGGGSGSKTPDAISETETFSYVTKPNNEVDLLFVIDNWSSTSEVQSKLNDQIPLLVSVLQSLPVPVSLHVAVVTTDMGAPGDSTSAIGCTPAGDQGVFQSAPRGTCTSTGLAPGDTFLSDNGNGVTNFTGDLATALQCISLFGGDGCGFGQPLAALDRALGGDGQGPPSANANFLRPEAYLAIVLLSNRDDCSAPTNTQLYSLNGGQQNITNPLGPISHYRCNQWGHLCTDPAAGNAQIVPPLIPPSDAQGTSAAPTLDLTDCISNDTGSGLLTPVSQFIADIKSLKPAPDSQIVVSGIVGPPTPYSVEWLPAPSGEPNARPGELWPDVENSCGAAGAAGTNPEATMHPTDGSFGEPAVRIAQFVNAFPYSVLASVCDPSYAPAVQAIANRVGTLPSPPCIGGKIQLNAAGLPDCTFTALFSDTNGNTSQETYQNCAVTGSVPPCWTLVTDPSCAGQTPQVIEPPNARSLEITLSCQICIPGVAMPGC